MGSNFSQHIVNQKQKMVQDLPKEKTPEEIQEENKKKEEHKLKLKFVNMIVDMIKEKKNNLPEDFRIELPIYSIRPLLYHKDIRVYTYILFKKDINVNCYVPEFIIAENAQKSKILYKRAFNTYHYLRVSDDVQVLLLISEISEIINNLYIHKYEDCFTTDKDLCENDLFLDYFKKQCGVKNICMDSEIKKKCQTCCHMIDNNDEICYFCNLSS